MRNGACPQYGATDIHKVPFLGGHRDFRPIKSFSKGIRLNEYVCGSCGLVNTYLADMSDVESIKERCEQVNAQE